MNDTVIKVLAVADPAVLVYIDKELDVMRDFDGEVQFDVVPWAEYYATMMDVFAGKASYDVIMVAGHLWKRDFVEKGYLAPIQFEDEDILPVIIQEMKYNDTVYLSPSFCDGHIIVYRKSLIGKDLGRLFGSSISAKEYASAAARLNSGDDIAPIAMKAHQSEIFTDALPFMRMNGQDVYDAVTQEAVCNNDGIIKGLEAYCGLKKYAMKNTDTFGNEEVADAIRNKKAAMAATWSGQLGVVYNEACTERDDLGFTTFDTAWNVTWAFAISANSKNKEKANELLRFLRSPKIDAIAGEHSGAPVRRQSYLDGMDKYPWYSCQLQMIENAKPIPDTKFSGIKNGILYEEIAKAFSEEKSPADAMADAQERINQVNE